MSKKIIICPDSFKGSVSARKAAESIARGVLRYDPQAEAILLPIADGGEGTLDAMVPAGSRIKKAVRDPLGRCIEAEYGYAGDTAIIEMASAAGLCLLGEDERSAADTSTYGVGELILDALGRGYRRLMITVGGSATNDGGSGMLEALGAVFYDADGNKMTSLCGRKLGKISKMDISDIDRRLFETEITFACDVTNPMIGERGATRIYGPQKGADADTLDLLESGMRNYADRLAEIGADVRDIAGSGAGGALPSPLLCICGARIRSGIDSVLSALDFDEKLVDTDLVITGEGKIDRQSAFGKAISGVVRRAAEKGIPVLALVGTCGEGADELKAIGLTHIAAISDTASDIADSIANADKYLEELGFREVKGYI